MRNDVLSLFFVVLALIAVGCEGALQGGDGDGQVGSDGGLVHHDATLPPGTDGGPGVCGDGVRQTGEACDDGNTAAGDGCSADCSAVDPNYACPVAGMMCVRIVTCGNGRIEGPETCDDRNTMAHDGCDANCMIEPGWICPVVGARCTAAGCGDGLVAGHEACDDGGQCNGSAGGHCTADSDCATAGDGDTCAPVAHDGCDATCQLEPGFACTPAGAPCHNTHCGDHTVEGTEECDDGNADIADGCTPFCTREPNCTDGTCVAVCGDEVVFAPETCDDGNSLGGDGCSSSCLTETGYMCVQMTLPDLDFVTLPIVVRDFIPSNHYTTALGARAEMGDTGATAPYGHPDFQHYSGTQTGMVQTDLVGGRPARSATATELFSDASFDLWYRTNTDYNRTVAQLMTLGPIGGGQYQFDSISFFPLSSPIDGSPIAGFPSEGLETLSADGNGAGDQDFAFTSEARFWFKYDGTETLAFSGDDDVWVFINGHLAVDLGGVHGRADGQITLSDCANADPTLNMAGCLSALDLRIDGIYEAGVFQAERHTTRSQYRLTLSNFQRAPSVCTSMCGDGVIASDEACDNGTTNGVAYGGCSATCQLTPYCGDGAVQTEYGEVCDDGLNLGGTASACAPGCMQLGGRCGDNVVQTDLGEQCDDGNTTNNDGCSSECLFELQ